MLLVEQLHCRYPAGAAALFDPPCVAFSGHPAGFLHPLRLILFSRTEKRACPRKGGRTGRTARDKTVRYIKQRVVPQSKCSPAIPAAGSISDMKIQYTLSDLFSCSVKIQYQQINKLEHQLESKKNQAEEPTSPALKSPQGTVTCEQLLYCAVQCAELLSPHLADHGTQLVALYLQPGPQLIAAVLGVWLAQSAWTPLDRKSPKKRLQDLVKQMQPSAVICDDDAPFKQLEIPLVHAQKLSFKGSKRIAQCEESLEGLAQVIYTSGSTGTPKGVMYTHSRLAHSTHFFAQQCEVSSSCRVLQKTPSIWSVFRHEVYPALCRGGLIIHPEPHRASDPIHLAEVITSNSVSLLVASSVEGLVPSFGIYSTCKVTTKVIHTDSDTPLIL